VWQAGPVCSTLYSTVSPSQSRAIATARCTWPLVSPFRQIAPRLRDQ
jgi:uncharacterized phage-associated protein